MAFKLGSFASKGEASFVGIVVGETVYPLTELMKHSGHTGIPDEWAIARSLDPLLQDWEQSLERLDRLAEAAEKLPTQVANKLPIDGATQELAIRAPFIRPSKILCAAANYRGHVVEMRSSGYGGDFDRKKDFMGEKSRTRPYLFLKAPSAICGPFDDIQLPAGDHQVDWEAELGVVVGRRARNIGAQQALDYIAGYVTTNDISCRTLLWREDRQSIRSDWLASKSQDTFAPIGPLFVPRKFVPDHNQMQITLSLNGEIKQDGSTAGMIFSPDEQIEYASRMMTLEPGDLFMTGTVAGVGQGKGVFLKAGDVLRTEVTGLGAQINKVIAPRIA